MHKEYILLNGFRKAKKGFTAGFHVPLTGRERFAAGPFLARVDANRTLAPSTLESGSRPEQVWTRP